MRRRQAKAQPLYAHAIEPAVVWGEGRCNLEIDGTRGWQLNVGVGGDSADLSPQDARASAALRAARRERAPRK
jgi:hypothetical protein